MVAQARSYEKTLPQDIEAEMGVLGSLIIDPYAIVQVADWLQPAHFYRDAHRTIYETILALSMQHEAADYITICDALERSGKLEDIGGAAYITSLINQVPTSGNVEYYANIVRRTGINRNIIKTAASMAAIGMDDADDGIEQVQSLVLELTREIVSTNGITHAGNILDTILSEIDSNVERAEAARLKNEMPMIGIPTGFKDFDRLKKGFQKQHMDVIAARTRIGKSSWMFNAALKIARQGYKVVMITLELSAKEVVYRLLGLISGINSQRMESGDIYDDEWQLIIDAIPVLKLLPLYLDDTPQMTVPQLQTKLQRQQLEIGVDIVFVDYLQLMQATGKHINRVEAVGEISRGIKQQIARGLDLSVVALAQVSREAERGLSKIPELSHLRESGAIEMDADSITFLYRDDVYNPESERKNIMDMYMKKNRHGPTGDVSLALIPDVMRLENLETVFTGEEQ